MQIIFKGIKLELKERGKRVYIKMTPLSKKRDNGAHFCESECLVPVSKTITVNENIIPKIQTLLNFI